MSNRREFKSNLSSIGRLCLKGTMAGDVFEADPGKRVSKILSQKQAGYGGANL
jgi:hypothetical protein